MKAVNRKLVFKWIAALAAVVVVLAWAPGYFGNKVFYLDDKKYSEKGTDSDGATIYKAGSGKPVAVIRTPEFAEVRIDGQSYRVERRNAADAEKAYLVVYPDGKSFTLKGFGDSGFLLAYDERGEIYAESRAYSNLGRIVSPGEEYYLPSELVHAAAEEYHIRQGNPYVFFFSLAFFAYGWLLFRKEALQRFHFRISYGLWVVDPEPSEFYFFMTKAGAVVGMVLSGLFFFWSLK